MMYSNTIVAAVTGGIGCGQSSVCKFLEKKGVKTIDVDLVAKQEIENNDEIKRELKKAFGSRIIYRNGKLNRRLLARIAFSDDAKTNRLNRIVHPHMISRILDYIERAREKQGHRIIAVDAALIYELNLEHMFDTVVVVASRMKNRIERIQQRDKLSEAEINDRINKQIPIEDKVKWGDFVIHNNGSLEQLEQKTLKLYTKLVNMAKKKQKYAI